MTSPARPTLPTQVSPPEFALSDVLPHAVNGVEVVALPVLPSAEVGGTPLLGPGAEELTDKLGLDLLGVLELDGASGKAGEVTSVPVP